LKRLFCKWGGEPWFFRYWDFRKIISISSSLAYLQNLQKRF